MITIQNNVFCLDTRKTSYWFRLTETGHLEHLHYGKKLKACPEVDPLIDKHSLPMGNLISYDENHRSLNMDNLCLETSSPDKGDNRESAIIVEYGQRGTRSLDFLYKTHRIFPGKPRTFSGLPESYGQKENCSTLEITLIDRVFPFQLILYYTVFDSCNVIAKHSVFINNSQNPVLLKKIASSQLDLFEGDFNLVSFDGAWARERIKNVRKIESGITILDSKTGVSGSSHNPCFYLTKDNTNSNYGDCYGFNLIYSGNHQELVEKTPFNKIRVLTGINPSTFSWRLDTGERFQSPEAILTFSSDGTNKASNNFHNFVNDHIVRGYWKLRQRPIPINNWEATYFDFNEKKLEKIAIEAKNLGLELFVLDDGWFGTRDDDTTSLGDWFVNTKKLPSGLRGFSERIHGIGLMFGLWVEPEMVSKDSFLQKKHPDWLIQVPSRPASPGRNQFILDLSRTEVQEYLTQTLTTVFQNGQVDYVKWDMNRTFSDIYSLNGYHHNEFNHRYVLGLYEILKNLTEKFPKVLFESCSSGGNRFDLGMLCYMPQTWSSDNTDVYCRTKIQDGTSYGYPQSTSSNHVSSSPNHQTLRKSSIESRFNVASFGILGYELDLTSLSTLRKKTIKSQIEFYKTYRTLLQFGNFHRIDTPDNKCQWVVSNHDKSLLIVLDFQTLNEANAPSDILKVNEVNPDFTYLLIPRDQRINFRTFGNLINMVSPIAIKNEGMVQKILDDKYAFSSEIESYLVNGDVLSYAGIKLNQKFSGTGFDASTRVVGDFGSRLYIIKKVNEEEIHSYLKNKIKNLEKIKLSTSYEKS